MGFTLTTDSREDEGLNVRDLADGTIFLSFVDDYAVPTLFMKCSYEADRLPGDEPKEYVVDLQTGCLFDDVDNYPVHKIIEDEFEVFY